MVGAGASTDTLRDVPNIIFVCSGNCDDGGNFEKDVVVRGFSVEFINFSGAEVLDWLMLNCSSGDFAAVVVSPPCSTLCRKFRRCTGSDVHGLNVCIEVVQISTKKVQSVGLSAA